MMKIDVLTLFPEMFECLNYSLLKRAVSNHLLEINIHNIRDYSKDKHRKCDDYPFGGGVGMVMMAQPIVDCIKSIKGYEQAYKIYLSPKGKTLCQKKVVSLSNELHLILLCGHYEGVDERVLENYIDEQISIGDYVLTGGELPAMVLIDSVARYIPGVLGNESSTIDESFSSNSLEYPQYTRPQIFEGKEVPEVLLSGNHAEIAKWRNMKSTEITKKNRPDLLK